LKTNEIAAATPSPGREETISSAALQSWRRDLIAQIERHGRFPSSARSQSGVASFAFSIDRSGRLLDVRISALSGSAALDQASLDLIPALAVSPLGPLPFLDAYRTMCIAPSPDFLQALEGISALWVAA